MVLMSLSLSHTLGERQQVEGEEEREHARQVADLTQGIAWDMDKAIVSRTGFPSSGNKPCSLKLVCWTLRRYLRSVRPWWLGLCSNWSSTIGLLCLSKKSC